MLICPNAATPTHMKLHVKRNSAAPHTAIGGDAHFTCYFLYADGSCCVRGDAHFEAGWSHNTLLFTYSKRYID